MFDIIIVQTSRAGFLIAEELVTQLGLQGRAYVLGRMVREKILGLVDPNRDQLFITGTLDGHAEPAVMLVRELRQRSSRLTCLSYTYEPMLSPPFHGHISKDTKDKPLDIFRQAIESYLAAHAST